MDEVARVSQLIGEIYDTAIDRALWPGLLEKTCEFVGGHSAALIVHEPARQSARFYVSWGCNPDYQRSYRETYAPMHSAAQLARIYVKIGEVAAHLDFISLEEFRRTRFYEEWARPQGHLDAVQTTVDKSAAGHAEITVSRHERHGIVDAGTRRRMRILAPHFRRAVAVAKLIEREKLEAAAFADTLDGLAAALFLVDAEARIVHANARGRALLARGAPVRSLEGRFSPRGTRADHALKAALAAARDAAAIETEGAAIPLEGPDGARWLAHVLPLTSGERRAAGAAYAAVAAVFVREATLGLPPLEVLARLYDLTPTELRVLLAIVKVGGVPEIAPVLGISESTVKTHLHRIFAKTGANRQADLVKLAAGVAGPIASPGPQAPGPRAPARVIRPHDAAGAEPAAPWGGPAAPAALSDCRAARPGSGRRAGTSRRA